MKILIVDYLALEGHIGYNSYHIKKIEELCDDVTFISKKSHALKGYVGNAKLQFFPDCYFKTYKSLPRSIYQRVQDFLKLIYLKKYLKKNRFDKIIFLSYDIMASGFIRYREESFLINHANVDGLRFKIKSLLTKWLPCNYRLIVLADYIKDNMLKYVPNQNIVVVPHGLTKDYIRNEGIYAPYGIEKFIFCPTTSSCDEKFFFNVITNFDVQTYLENNGITLIIKSNTIKEKYPNTFIVNNFIDEDTYSSLMLGAIAIFAPYDSSFNNRISGVLMECIGNNIPIISCSSSACFNYAKKYANYDMIVETPTEFISTLERVQKKIGGKFYQNVDELDALPYWKNILAI